MQPPTENKTSPSPPNVQNQLVKRVRFEDDSKDSTNDTERTFHPFPRLPIELRFQIWESHLPSARVLEFKPFEKERAFNLLCYSLYPTLVSKFEKKPLGVLPYVCHDSRECFLSSYSLCFDVMLQQPIYFNPKIDVVLFSNEYALELFSDAVNHLPSAESRESIAPVRKAAIQWLLPKDYQGAPYRTTAAQQNTVDNLALDLAGGTRYRTKMRILLERLPNLKEFAFCYPWQTMSALSKEKMVQFVERLEEQMRERMQMAKENRNKSIAEAVGKCPSIVVLHFPTGRAYLQGREQGRGPVVRNEWGRRVTTTAPTMDLASRTWECSRYREDFKDPRTY
ncbi:hypothetical protein N431DRAFT_395888 [Stipitochalara longipes BDJ]|nr:hypothetical protein N431DRAFT_395888 [Stipitochalara longipes BDJ]